MKKSARRFTKVIERLETKKQRTRCNWFEKRSQNQTKIWGNLLHFIFLFGAFRQTTTKIFVSRKTEKSFQLYLFTFSFVFIENTWMMMIQRTSRIFFLLFCLPFTDVHGFKLVFGKEDGKLNERKRKHFFRFLPFACFPYFLIHWIFPRRFAFDLIESQLEWRTKNQHKMKISPQSM